jgi:hypothetical protein
MIFLFSLPFLLYKRLHYLLCKCIYMKLCKQKVEKVLQDLNMNNVQKAEAIFTQGTNHETRREFDCAKYCFNEAARQYDHAMSHSSLSFLLVNWYDRTPINDSQVASHLQQATEKNWTDLFGNFKITTNIIKEEDMAYLTDDEGRQKVLTSVVAKNILDDLRLYTNTDQDYMKFKTLCHLGLLLSEPRNPCFDSALSLKVLHYGYRAGRDAEAAFWLGRALRVGIGFPWKNDEFGSALVEAAAAKRVRRAMFEKGLMFELPPPRPNYSFAYMFYDAVARSKRDDRVPIEYIDEFEMHILWQSPAWHAMQDSMGDVFSRTLSWELAGQSFLFGAAAVLATDDCSLDRYWSLQWIIPMIGFFFGLFATWSCLIVFCLNQKRRSKLLCDVYEAKLQACIALVGERRVIRLMGMVPHKWMARICALGECGAILISASFVAAWIILFFQQNDPYDCTKTSCECYVRA